MDSKAIGANFVCCMLECAYLKHDSAHCNNAVIECDWANDSDNTDSPIAVQVYSSVVLLGCAISITEALWPA